MSERDSERWEPTPIPLGDGRHDIGDDTRAAIVRRLTDDWSHDPDLAPEKVRQLAMWAGASIRALLHELGTLRDFAGAKDKPESVSAGSREQAQKKQAYRVEVESGGCSHCNAGKLWAVVGPDDVAHSTMFEDIEDAESLADALNEAYESGRRRWLQSS